MSQSSPAPATGSRSSRADVLDFLDSLDSLPADSPTPSTTTTPGLVEPTPSSVEDAQSVLDFLDEITQRSSTPTAPIPSRISSEIRRPIGSLSRSGSRVDIVAAGSTTTPSSRGSAESTREKVSTPVEVKKEAEEGGWGWSSVWNSATTIVQQARVVAEEQVVKQTGDLYKALGEGEGRKWGEAVVEGIRKGGLDQIGKDLKSTTLKSLTDLLNAVAPPIAEHELLKVSLSHDMLGYDGVETLVYRGLAKIMDQIEGGTLVVNKGENEVQKPEGEVDGEHRNLNYVEGMAEGWKLAEANLEQLIKNSYSITDALPSPLLTTPITTCPIYLRIQPTLAPLPFHPTATANALFFLLILRDPTHGLVHYSTSQSMPAAWLDIPYEENEWVEDVMVESIRKSVEVIGQEYISHRMRAQGEAISKARSEAQSTLDSTPVDPVEEEKKEVEVSEAMASARIV